MRLPSKWQVLKQPNTSFLFAAVALLSFFTFTQSAFHFWPKESFIFGIAIDYLAIRLYLTDILVLVLLAAAVLSDDVRRKLATRQTAKQLLFIAGLLLINLSVSVFYYATLIKWLKVVELFLVWQVLTTLTKSQFSKFVLKSLLFSLPLVVAIGAYQVIVGESTGVFSLLGERLMDVSFPGLAKRFVFGSETLRAYSTFSHPNSLAGYLVTLFFLSLYFFKEGLLTKKLFFLATILTVAGLLLAQSYFACFVFLVLILIYQIAKRTKREIYTGLFLVIVLTSFLLPALARYLLASEILVGESMLQRLLQYSAFSLLTVKDFFFGSGLNTFVVYQRAYYAYPFAFQPIHNGVLMLFKEGGVLLLGIFGLIVVSGLRAMRKSASGIALVFCIWVLTLVDHYQFTLQQNLLLNTYLFALVFAKEK